MDRRVLVRLIRVKEHWVEDGDEEGKEGEADRAEWGEQE